MVYRRKAQSALPRRLIARTSAGAPVTPTGEDVLAIPARPPPLPPDESLDNRTSKEAWLYGEGPSEKPSEEDDFEGSRNWAVLLILLALVCLPIAALVMILG